MYKYEFIHIFTYIHLYLYYVVIFLTWWIFQIRIFSNFEILKAIHLQYSIDVINFFLQNLNILKNQTPSIFLYPTILKCLELIFLSYNI